MLDQTVRQSASGAPVADTPELLQLLELSDFASGKSFQTDRHKCYVAGLELLLFSIFAFFCGYLALRARN